MLGLKNKIPHLVAALSLLTTPPPETPSTNNLPESKRPETPATENMKSQGAPMLVPQPFILKGSLSFKEAAESIEADIAGFARWNPPHPVGKLPPGTIVHKPPTTQHGTPDEDPRVTQVPYTVRLIEGMTLSGLAHTFKVPLEILMDENCPGGEVDARKLKVGRDIIIPLFQNLAKEGYALEGLRFNNHAECLRIASRLVNAWSGPSTRREHLAVAFQHIPPEQRKATISSIVEALHTLRDVLAQGKEANDTLRAARVGAYAQALESAKPLNDIDNPFRLSPHSLTAISEQRDLLRDPNASLPKGKLVTIIGSKGDHNGAFPTIDGAIEAALKAGRIVNYFEVGKVSSAVNGPLQVATRHGRGNELVFIAGHGSFDAHTNTGAVHFAFSSVYQHASTQDRESMRLSSRNTDALRTLVKATQSGGSIVYLSCYSGSGIGDANNMVVATAHTASEEGKVITISGAPCATNLKSISFHNKKADPVEVSYLDGQCVRISSAVPVKREKQSE